MTAGKVITAVLAGSILMTHCVPLSNVGVEQWIFTTKPTGNVYKEKGLTICPNPFTYITDVEIKIFSENYSVRGTTSDNVPVNVEYNVVGQLDPDKLPAAIIELKTNRNLIGLDRLVLNQFIMPEANSIIVDYLARKTSYELSKLGSVEEFSSELERKLKETNSTYALLDGAKIIGLNNITTTQNLKIN